MIRDVTINDAKGICDIYNHYILNSIVTFEEKPVETEEMSARIKSTSSKFPWVVFEEQDQILGYAYASAWKSRHAYRHSAESTVYIKSDEVEKGIGKKLYTQLMKELGQMDIHVVMGGIALPNEASIALHEKLGFKKVAHLEEVGFKFGKWVDVGYWELIL